MTQIIWLFCGERRSPDKAADRGTVVQSHLPPFRNLGDFVRPTLPVSFGRDTKSRWSLLSGVYGRGSKRSHTGGKCVTCSGPTNSREKNNTCASLSLGCLEVNHLRLRYSVFFASQCKALPAPISRAVLSKVIVNYFCKLPSTNRLFLLSSVSHLRTYGTSSPNKIPEKSGIA